MLLTMGVPAGTTLETLCPVRCETPACLGVDADECASAPCGHDGACSDALLDYGCTVRATRGG